MTCGACGGEATRPLCHGCTTRLEWLLAETDALVEELDTTITRQSKTRSTGSAPSGERPLPYSVAASDAAAGHRYTLKHWTGWAAEQLHNEGVHVNPPTPATASRLASFLLTHTDWISRRDEGPDMHRDLTAAVKECQRAIDTAMEYITLGPCGGTLDGVECVEHVRAPKDAPQVSCRVCGSVHDVPERRAGMLANAWDIPVTAVEASRMIPGVTQAQVWNWVRRGHLTQYAGRTYVLAHVHRLARLRATGARLTHIDKETA